MKPRDFQKLLLRDSYCLHCGATEALASNHRANRGMGGSKLYDVPSNLVLLCSRLNGDLEAGSAALGIKYGWKVSKWADWRAIPVYDSLTGEWWLLDDEWNRIKVNPLDK